jgi:hypothetical protein
VKQYVSCYNVPTGAEEVILRPILGPELVVHHGA